MRNVRCARSLSCSVCSLVFTAFTGPPAQERIPTISRNCLAKVGLRPPRVVSVSQATCSAGDGLGQRFVLWHYPRFCLLWQALGDDPLSGKRVGSEPLAEPRVSIRCAPKGGLRSCDIIDFDPRRSRAGFVKPFICARSRRPSPDENKPSDLRCPYGRKFSKPQTSLERALKPPTAHGTNSPALDPGDRVSVAISIVGAKADSCLGTPVNFVAF